MPNVLLHEHHIKSKLTQRKVLKTFIPTIFLKEKCSLQQLSIIFCTDEYLLEINKEALRHNYYTDIITFDLSDTDSNSIEGELYISIDRVKDNAINFKVTYMEELHRVIFHGILHLCGYKDKSKSDIAIMRKKESYYLSQYFKKTSSLTIP
jgi:probable rRNA maturation factor